MKNDRQQSLNHTTRWQKFVLVMLGVTIGLIIPVAWLMQWQHKETIPGELVDAPRQVLDSNPRALFAYDKDMSFRLKPNFQGVRYGTDTLPHSTNSLGLVGKDEIPPNDDVPRVLFLGDSVAYGYGVAEKQTFVHLVNDNLKNSVKCYNASCPCWSTFQELVYFKKILQSSHWDLVVLVVCLNDLLTFEWVYDSSERPRLSEELLGLNDMMQKKYGLWKIKLQLAYDPKTRPLAQHHGGFLASWDDSYWHHYTSNVLNPLLSTIDTPVIVMVIPTAYQVEAYNLGAAASTVFYPQNNFMKYCKEHNIAYVDALPAFRSPEGAVPLFIDDCHLTDAGHLQMAVFVGTMIKSAMTINKN